MRSKLTNGGPFEPHPGWGLGLILPLPLDMLTHNEKVLWHFPGACRIIKSSTKALVGLTAVKAGSFGNCGHFVILVLQIAFSAVKSQVSCLTLDGFQALIMLCHCRQSLKANARKGRVALHWSYHSG
jgi:hypothetical protein